AVLTGHTGSGKFNNLTGNPELYSYVRVVYSGLYSYEWNLSGTKKTAWRGLEGKFKAHPSNHKVYIGN
ncbi:MAG: hypothetical protein QG610_2134, partial [Euryarchaeota archaeon]|nr:hypothetical protein [Euryarchaeota archaeon]